MGQQTVNTESTSGAPLTGKTALFVAEYQKDHNATQAAIRAGYSAKTAKQQGSRLLTNPDIRRAIDAQTEQRIAQVAHETGITLERTLRELARIGYFDPRKLFDKDGRPLSITELDDDTAAVVAGLDVLEEFEGSGADRVLVGHVKKWKLSDKKGALDMLMKHLGGYAKDNEQGKPAQPAPVAVPTNQTARELAYALHLGMKNAEKAAANDTVSQPRQAAS
jgi:phage terminase small subunit